jgi:hypothetical protein
VAATRRPTANDSRFPDWSGLRNSQSTNEGNNAVNKPDPQISPIPQIRITLDLRLLRNLWIVFLTRPFSDLLVSEFLANFFCVEVSGSSFPDSTFPKSLEGSVSSWPTAADC